MDRWAADLCFLGRKVIRFFFKSVPEMRMEPPLVRKIHKNSLRNRLTPERLLLTISVSVARREKILNVVVEPCCSLKFVFLDAPNKRDVNWHSFPCPAQARGR